MARQKKIEKYVPQTKYPKKRSEHTWIEKEGVPFGQLISDLKVHHDALRQKHGAECYLPYRNYVEQWDRGELTEANYLQSISEWRYQRFCREVFQHTALFRRINEQFLAEFDSREDLQYIYAESMKSTHWVYNISEDCIDVHTDKNHPFRTRPDSYKMFDYAVSHYGRSTIELSRETPYVEGDLVLLRDTAIDRDSDPLRISRWTPEYQAGQRTPDKSIPRIATVISVTDKLSQSWRPVKGSKVLKVMWLGGDGRVVDIEERWVKWHQRPTYKNGLKERPAE